MAQPLWLLLKSLHYVYPTLVFTYYMVCSAVATCTLQTSASRGQHPRRRLVASLLLIAALSYFAQAVLLLLHWRSARTDTVVCLLSCVLVYMLEFAVLHDTENPLWYPYIGSVVIALVFDPLLEALSLSLRADDLPKPMRLIEVSLVSTRSACILLLLLVYFGWRKTSIREAGTDSERQSLLRKKKDGDSEDTLIVEYGSADGSSVDSNKSSDNGPECDWERRERLAKEQRDKRLKETGNWVTYAKSFKLFLPYVWPVNNRGLQLRAVLVGLCLLANNGLNLLIPRQLGIIADILADAKNKRIGSNPYEPWIQVLIFAGLRLTASEAGISLIRQRLWLPVELYSERAIIEAAHRHVMNLDAHFHDTKSLSDVLMAIQHGQSISNMLETLCFQALPNLIDLVVAFIYLAAKFGPYEGLITISTSTIFLYISTTIIARMRTARQGEISAYFEEFYVLQSGIQGWTTASAFNQVKYEQERYSAVVRDRISKQKLVFLGYLSARALQYLVLLAGLLAGSFLAVYRVTHDDHTTAGDFVTLLTYWAQLVAPLNFFAGLGRNVSRDLLQAERLLDIMQTKPKVVNKSNAPPFKFKAGFVEFEDVDFSYDDKKQVLKNLTFSVTPGMTIAFVGQTGAGKSTILKLLDRFYDVTGGRIEIDGQDIREVDLYSLRGHIGVVPQNPVLFNDTVMNNIRYAKLDATDDEVFEACRAAAIHEQILGFSDGYKTRVGERGLKLSGGELQRVAIARAILKQPKIVLLDEATSAVDTETESQIQDALRRLCKGRTTFIVAHRLSTIVNADRIIVVSNGEVLEQGNHDSLISAGGKYADLWSKQIFVKPKEQDSDEEEDGSNGQNLVTPKASTATGKRTGEANDEESTKDAAKQPAEVKTPSGHKREGSKLNPDAAEFTPRSMLAAIGSAIKTGRTPRGLLSPVPVNATTATPALCQSSDDPPVIRLPGPVGRSSTQSASDGSTDHDLQSTETTRKPGTVQENNKRKTSYKIPRYIRQVQCRSEPYDSQAMS